MSVLLQSPAGWLLDHLRILNSQYCQGTLLCFKEEFFQLLRPHISGGVSSVHTAEPPPTVADHSDVVPSNSRKRKRRQSALNQGELDAVEYHVKISALISEGSKVLVSEGFKNGFLGLPSGKEKHPCTAAGAAQVCVCRLAELCEMAKQLPVVNEKGRHVVQVMNEETVSTSELDLLSHLVENNADSAKIIPLMGEKYLLPPKCSFLLSDISCLQPLLDYGKKFDVIVLDPPWQNKSVKRNNRYSCLPSCHLKQLPVPELASPDCLVITWVTNRQKHLRFVKDELYPHWSVEPLAEWHWVKLAIRGHQKYTTTQCSYLCVRVPTEEVKITRSGEFVFPLHSTHKKPYEVLVLGRISANTSSPSREPVVAEPPIPEHKLIVSVPCILHSHKPPLTEVLTEYIKPGAARLELFARNLQTGWTSWGNEVLKFQHIDYFRSLEDAS